MQRAAVSGLPNDSVRAGDAAQHSQLGSGQKCLPKGL